MLKISRRLFFSGRPRWFKALDKKASGGDVSALKLAFELTGVYIPRSEHKLEDQGPNSREIAEGAIVAARMLLQRADDES